MCRLIQKIIDGITQDIDQLDYRFTKWELHSSLERAQTSRIAVISSNTQEKQAMIMFPLEYGSGSNTPHASCDSPYVGPAVQYHISHLHVRRFWPDPHSFHYDTVHYSYGVVAYSRERSRSNNTAAMLSGRNAQHRFYNHDPGMQNTIIHNSEKIIYGCINDQYKGCSTFYSRGMIIGYAFWRLTQGNVSENRGKSTCSQAHSATANAN